MNIIKKNKAITIGIVLGVIIACGAVFVLLNLFTTKDFSYEFCCAVIGMIATALVTYLLLQGQSSSEEKKDKNIKIHENKIAAYSSFISKLWKTIEDDDISNNEWREIREGCFSSLIFYLNDAQLKEINLAIQKIHKLRDDAESNKGKNAYEIKKQFSAITKCLINDIDPDRQLGQGKDILQGYEELFNSFNISNDDEADSESLKEEANSEMPNSQTQTNKYMYNPVYKLDDSLWKVTFWHFTALDYSKQKQNLQYLALIEYGEDWRTSAIRQVKEGDLIFLFSRGGSGYRGVFRAKNVEGTNSPALVFKVDWDKYGDGKDEEYTRERNDAYEKAKAFDIYDGFKDGASICSAINVEQVYFNSHGIGNPIATRRSTIVRINQWKDRKALVDAFDKANNYIDTLNK